MKLFTIGPVQMFEEIKNFRRNIEIPYFRTKEFSNLMLETDLLLKKFAGTAESSQSIYLTASGTGAMEAVILNCFSSNDKLLVINGGTFGQRFSDICEIHKIPYAEIKLSYGEKLSAEHFKIFENENFTGLLVNIHETSTGQLYDINLISDFCKQKNLFLVVDAISSFLCDKFAMDKFGIDAMITSSQKGVCVEPGMSIVILNQKIFNRRVLKLNSNSLYFDFKLYAKNFLRGQTPFTPAVGICLEINAALRLIDKEGLDNHLEKIKNLAADFRQKVKILPVQIPSYPLSNAITPIIFNSNVAYRVFEILKDRHNIFVNPTGGALSEKLLRISHIGDLNFEDNTFLIYCLKEIIDELKIN